MFIIPFIISPIIFFIVFFVIIIFVIKNAKRFNQFQNSIFDASKEVFNNVKQKLEQNSQVKKCEYCGTQISANEKDCPNCGASVKNKK